MAAQRNCLIIGSVEEPDGALLREYAKDAFIICADGGWDNARRCGITPHLLVGDFDSVRSELPQGIETIRLPEKKDDTDMLFAVREGFRRGCTSFWLTGAVGGARFDHSIANLSVLYFIASRGGKGAILSSTCDVFLLMEGRLTLTEMAGRTVSVFPFAGPRCTVSYQGLEYPLTAYPLSADLPLGVSNRVLGQRAEIHLHEGVALVIVEKTEDRPEP